MKNDVLRLAIFPPVKTERKYHFRFLMDFPVLKDGVVDRKKRDAKFLLKRWILSIMPGLSPRIYGARRFGFIAENFDIEHHQVWDSIYPLMHLIRGGGPIFGTKFTKCHFVFLYPILKEVQQFYIGRARDYGIDLTIEGPSFTRTYNDVTSGNSMALGGGKDSRLVYGLLSEIGPSPSLFNANAGSDDVPDLDVNRVTTLQFGITNRIMAAFMSMPKNMYIGSGLGDTHFNYPWHEYFEWATAAPMKEFSSLLSSLGIEMEVSSPVNVLPFNLIQKILYQRYPDLYKYQYSIAPEQKSEKNLHISLCKIYHDIDFSGHCSEGLFKSLLKDFVEEEVSAPDGFGYRNSRELVRREMRSIIYRMRDHQLFSGVREVIPGSWDEKWIDYIHDYIFPDIDQRIMNIYTEYAKKVTDCFPDGEGYISGYEK